MKTINTNYILLWMAILLFSLLAKPIPAEAVAMKESANSTHLVTKKKANKKIERKLKRELRKSLRAERRKARKGKGWKIGLWVFLIILCILALVIWFFALILLGVGEENGQPASTADSLWLIISLIGIIAGLILSLKGLKKVFD